MEADGTLLARAFSNLLGNAIKYGRDGKRLFLQMGQETPETVSFHIINFGEVIPTEDLERIFERFYRVDAARTEEQGGTGLGLAIAKSFTELQGGVLELEVDGDLFKVTTTWHMAVSGSYPEASPNSQ